MMIYGEKYLHGEAIVYFKKDKDDELCSKGFYRFDGGENEDFSFFSLMLEGYEKK